MNTRCCIAGGGPAGMVLGFLLARAGVEVVVLEKHKDFLRDFRGDTIHPSTLELMYELGLLEDFLQPAASETETYWGTARRLLGDRRGFYRICPSMPKFVGLMPGSGIFWNFMAGEGGEEVSGVPVEDGSGGHGLDRGERTRARRAREDSRR